MEKITRVKFFREKFTTYLRGKLGLKVYKSLFFILFIFFSCTQRSDLTHSVSKEDRKDLQNLMNYFLFDNHAAFVLFGSKPISEIILHPPKSVEEEKELFASLPEELKAQAKVVKYPFNAYQCWNTWKKNRQNFSIQGFLLVERPLKIDPTAIDVFVVNIKGTVSILQEHYEYFKEIYGKDFDPSIEVLALETTDSSFWNCILCDHIAQGLLFGYGEKNARSFAETMQEGKFFEKFDFSTSKKIEGYKASKRNFSIPKFRSFQDEEIVKIYQREQKRIEEIYRKGDVLEITLKKLTEKP